MRELIFKATESFCWVSGGVTCFHPTSASPIFLCLGQQIIFCQDSVAGVARPSPKFITSPQESSSPKLLASKGYVGISMKQICISEPNPKRQLSTQLKSHWSWIFFRNWGIDLIFLKNLLFSAISTTAVIAFMIHLSHKIGEKEMYWMCLVSKTFLKIGSHLSPDITGYKACSSSLLSSPSKVSSEVFKKFLNKTLEIPSEKRKKFTVPIEQLWFEYLITNLVIQVEAFVFKRLGSHSFWHYSLSTFS